MIVYLAKKTRFRDDILSIRIEDIVHESFHHAADAAAMLSVKIADRAKSRSDR